MLPLKLLHVSRLLNPNYLTPTAWRNRRRFQIVDKKAHLLLADEQLFQPYTYFSVTLYLHFHVVNSTFMNSGSWRQFQALETDPAL